MSDDHNHSPALQIGMKLEKGNYECGQKSTQPMLWSARKYQSCNVSKHQWRHVHRLLTKMMCMGWWGGGGGAEGSDKKSECSADSHSNANGENKTHFPKFSCTLENESRSLKLVGKYEAWQKLLSYRISRSLLLSSIKHANITVSLRQKLCQLSPSKHLKFFFHWKHYAHD